MEKKRVEVRGIEEEARQDLLKDKIHELKGKVEANRARLSESERAQADRVITHLEDVAQTRQWVVFDGIVNGSEDYLLAFVRGGKIALMEDFFRGRFVEKMDEILFHEGYAAVFGEEDYRAHRRIYRGIQRKIFGSDNPLKEVLRNYIDGRNELTALETTLQRGGLAWDAYWAFAYAVGSIAWNRSELAESALTALETTLQRGGLYSNAYWASADAVRSIALNRPELAERSLTALETTLQMGGLASYVYWASTDAIAFIAENRPELRLRAEQMLSLFLIHRQQGSPESPGIPDEEEVQRLAIQQAEQGLRNAPSSTLIEVMSDPEEEDSMQKGVRRRAATNLLSQRGEGNSWVRQQLKEIATDSDQRELIRQYAMDALAQMVETEEGVSALEGIRDDSHEPSSIRRFARERLHHREAFRRIRGERAIAGVATQENQPSPAAVPTPTTQRVVTAPTYQEAESAIWRGIVMGEITDLDEFEGALAQYPEEVRNFLRSHFIPRVFSESEGTPTGALESSL